MDILKKRKFSLLFDQLMWHFINLVIMFRIFFSCADKFLHSRLSSRPVLVPVDLIESLELVESDNAGLVVLRPSQVMLLLG